MRPIVGGQSFGALALLPDDEPELEAPVEVELLNTRDPRPYGLGESSQGSCMAAIANAVTHALGARIRDLPLTRERIIAALSR